MHALIHLNFINQSGNTNNSPIVIFSKNEAAGSGGPAVAWKVIRDCMLGCHHVFPYPLDNYITANDSFGASTPKLLAEPGKAFQYMSTLAGNQLVPNGNAGHASAIEVHNHLPQGVINVRLYKDNRLFALKTGMISGQVAVFSTKPVIYIGVLTSAIEEGELMDATMISSIHDQFSLAGISSADIVMTGGGSGTGAIPLQFTLQNVVKAEAKKIFG